MHQSTSKDDQTTTAQTSVSFEQRPSGATEVTVFKRVNKRRKFHQDPEELLLFSDPLDGSSSDEQSFDEDDMCGSDSDVETISLGFRSNVQTRQMDAPVVCSMKSPVLVRESTDM